MANFVHRTTHPRRIVEELSARGLVLTREQHGSGPEHHSLANGEDLIEIYPSDRDRACERCAGAQSKDRPITICRGCLNGLLSP